VNELVPATADSDIADIRQLFQQYAASLDIDLAFQHFEHELAALPGDYASPRGALFLARVDGAPVGCIGLRPFSSSVGELKRLYVLPAFRGRGLARSLVSAAITAARAIGYGALVLDTLASMRAAIALYESFGFERTEAYYPNPLPDALYFRASLELDRDA
jgi:ribosomal protein S18 acetylase RimI-like enzyme